ncbi:MAG TPA: hypothetical protein VM261_02240 [Kofleriaceae bacterium]|nr:hypothetical protein [Kofleriaceae bacterium]
MASSSALAFSLLAAIALVAPAHADTPAIGDVWVWPTAKDWLEGQPVGNDAAGKVVVHWFCKPKVEDCKIDLARIYNMREQGSIYVIAYINGSKRDATKLDPVRGDVGAGAVAYGKSVAALFKKLSIGAALPMSIVLDVDGKVALVTYTGDPDQLDARDKKVATLVDAIKTFEVHGTCPVAPIKKGERFELNVSAEIASWLTFDASVQPEIKLTLPPDVTCEATVLKGAAIKMTGRKLTAVVGCRGSVKGSYEATGSLRFSYRAPNKAIGVGEDAVRWRFTVAP